MFGDVHEYAPAKINLALRVFPLRPDGYHNIESIFQQVTLYDELYVTCVGEGQFCDVYVADAVLPKENTLTKTYFEFVKITGIQFGIKVTLVKNIPMGAGLGGGSSDAAALINALDKMFQTRLTFQQKKEIALCVGSDVLFFLVGATALVSGRGDVVQVIKQRERLWCVLVYPDVHSSTKEGYLLVDEYLEKGDATQYPSFQELEKMYYDSVKNWRFYNTFTVPLIEKYSEIASAIEDVVSTGASYVQMSGSGSVVFGIYESEVVANEALKKMQLKWQHCFVVEFV